MVVIPESYAHDTGDCKSIPVISYGSCEFAGGLGATVTNASHNYATAIHNTEFQPRFDNENSRKSPASLA